MRNEIIQALNNLKSDIDAIVNDECSVDKLVYLSKIFETAHKRNIPVFMTGVGKTTFAAHKLSCTAASIGINAIYVDCQNAGHGDIGLIPVENDSVCLFLSKSGKTVEHYALANLLRKCRPNCRCIMLCFANDATASDLRQKETGMHEILNIPVDCKESDGDGIVPTNSNALFEACISSAMISSFENHKLKMYQTLQQNHPSGSLHDKVTKKIQEIIK